MADKTEDPDQPSLSALEADFLKALELREKGQSEEARSRLAEIIRLEPRLPEPHLELGRILLEAERLEDAEAEVREAIALLEKGGQWLENLPDLVVQALAWALLGEILKERAATDEVVFGPPERFHAMLAASRAAFKRAHELDPEDLASALTAEELEADYRDDDEVN
jgi:tetratricopeptide (TPR) repeat protein